MLVLAQIARWEMTFLLCAFAAVVAFQLLTGRINTRYLLWGTLANEKRYFSPERVQLLIFTLVTAFQIVQQVSENPSAAKLPEISQKWVALLASSHGVYLAGKGISRFVGGRDNG
ncbi:MAG TPA: hypothetical protein VKU19_32810 [Bryobacteraceae bacterium]|nr:hypothetical protein [Bryobacteraceae bacterium]